MSEVVVPVRVMDWTVDPETGRANASEEFTELVAAVEQVLLESAGCIDRRGAASTARLVMAQLAHVHRLSPGWAALQCCVCWLTEREETASYPASMVVSGLSVCAPHAVYCQSGQLAAVLRGLQERRGASGL